MFGETKLDPSRLLLKRGNRAIELTAWELPLMAMLMAGFGKIVTNEEVLAFITEQRSGDAFSKSLPKVRIHLLRKKIAPLDLLIQSVRRRGYILMEKQP